MLKDIEKDIFRNELEKLYLSFFSRKLRVGVVGGGKAATIKIKTLINKNIYVEVIACDFTQEILRIESEKLKLIKGSYNDNFIQDKHLIIIAINDVHTIKQIKDVCDKNYKIYIDATNFREGMGAVPVQRELDNISFGISTNTGNPKGALFAAGLVVEALKDIDEFLGLTSKLRNNVKNNEALKEQLITFINQEDFKFFWSKGKERHILNLFFNEKDIEILYK